MDPTIGLLIQLAAVLLIALLTLVFRRSTNLIGSGHWTNAWFCLSLALAFLWLAVSFELFSKLFLSLYFLSDCCFGLLFIAGCVQVATGKENVTWWKTVLPPFALTAVGLAFLANDQNLVLSVHSLAMSGIFITAALALCRMTSRTLGWQIMLVALSLITVNFIHYFLSFGARYYLGAEFAFPAYAPILDLFLQISLEFGLVIVIFERLLAEAKGTHAQLQQAHKKLEELASVDPLTTALNRHAFHGYLNRHGDANQPVSGCVGFFDVDDLKTVNDVYGHAAGDMVIRAAVKAIREIIRAEDLIFRWGGDEFFVIMVGLDAEVAMSRMKRMDEILSNVKIDAMTEPLAIHVSHAFENFADLSDLESTIKCADAGMYRQKQIRKGLMDPNRRILPGTMTEREVLIGA